MIVSLGVSSKRVMATRVAVSSRVCHPKQSSFINLVIMIGRHYWMDPVGPRRNATRHKRQVLKYKRGEANEVLPSIILKIYLNIYCSKQTDFANFKPLSCSVCFCREEFYCRHRLFTLCMKCKEIYCILNTYIQYLKYILVVKLMHTRQILRA